MSKRAPDHPTKGDATRAALMKAGAEIFGEQGYLNAKVTEIAARAGKSAGVLYVYFTNKAALLSALLDDVDLDMTYLGFYGEQVPARNWDFGLKDYWEFYRNHWATVVAFRDAALVDHVFDVRHREYRARGRARLSEIVKINQQGGNGLGLSPEFAAVALGEMVEAVALRWFQHHAVSDRQSVDEADAYRTVTQIFEQVLGKPRSLPPDRAAEPLADDSVSDAGANRPLRSR